MTRITNIRGDLQAESSVWLFKSPLARGGGILWRPHYRLHSLLKIVLPVQEVGDKMTTARTGRNYSCAYARGGSGLRVVAPRDRFTPASQSNQR